MPRNHFYYTRLTMLLCIAALHGCGFGEKATLQDRQPGTVLFSNTRFITKETSPYAEITLQRINGRKGEVSVTFDTSEGTASAPEDYQNISQTVVWRNGDSQPKIIRIPIFADVVGEPDELVNLLISNPTGGVLLGATTSASLLIVDIPCDNSVQDLFNATPLSGCFAIDQNVTVADQQHLRIPPGATLLMTQNTSITIQSGGTFTSAGTETLPVRIAGTQPASGFWQGLEFENYGSSHNEIVYTSIENAGSADVYSSACLHAISSPESLAKFTIQHTILRGCRGVGAHFSGPLDSLKFENNIIAENSIGSMFVDVSLLSAISDTNRYSNNDKNEIFIDAGADIHAAMTFYSRNDAYVFVANKILTSDNALFIEPGTTIHFMQGAGIRIQSGGSFKASGTEQQPILLNGYNDQTWQGIEFNNAANNELRYLTIDGANNSSYNASLSLLNNANASIQHTLFNRSAGFDLYLDGNTRLDEFSNITLTSVSVAANAAHFLNGASGSTTVFIHQDNFGLRTTQQWPAMRYRIQQNYDIPVYADLSIATGAQLAFEENSGITINQTGSLNAVGNPESRIIFEGVEHARGFWNGLYFENSNSDNNVLQEILIQDGGGRSAYPANIAFIGTAFTPVKANLKNSAIMHSKGYGLWISYYSAITTTNNTFHLNNSGDAFVQR